MTSIPKGVLRLLLRERWSGFGGVPISLNSLWGLSATLSGFSTGNFAAASTRAPYFNRRPLGVWMTSPLRARQEAAPTPHFSAAALTSIVRVTAPAWRIGIQAPRMALELPVA